jgi:DNA-binding transcriptional LysR family regulator
MVSLKQIEALHWIVTLGTIQRAADKMNTTQSAVSKRIQELETSLGFAVFDRSQRRVRLTTAGEQVLELGRDMLALSDRLKAVNSDTASYAGKLRLGITQLSAMTWLPRFAEAVAQAFPKIDMVVDVATARTLYDRVLEDTVDLAVLPDFFRDETVMTTKVGEVENSLVASPHLIEHCAPVDFNLLSQQTVLMQSSKSVTGAFYSRWLQENGIHFSRSIFTDNILALTGLAMAKLGVALIPHNHFPNLFSEGHLVKLDIGIEGPKLPYVIMYRDGTRSSFIDEIGGLIMHNFSFAGSVLDVLKS